jgi:D-beta-D-heptose 7-phosphate kinase/D-beta-D-heptose 1-phosphate adenosyltransferase
MEVVMGKKTICVLGDPMLDVYQHVTPTRVSSEAPVLICQRGREDFAPGGAANVAVNLKFGFEQDVQLIGVIGGDDAGRTLIKCLEGYGVESDWVLGAKGWVTPEKRRFVDAAGRQIGFRIDTELDNPVLAPTIQARLREGLYAAAQEADGLVVSDYGKGTVTGDLAQYAIRQFRESGKCVIVNGKPGNLAVYRGASLLVYNLAEAQDAVQSTDAPETLAALLYERLGRETDLLITLGDRGMLFCSSDGTLMVSVVPTTVVSVVGAGDVVVATIAAAGHCDKEVLDEAAVNAAAAISQQGTSIHVGKG